MLVTSLASCRALVGDPLDDRPLLLVAVGVEQPEQLAEAEDQGDRRVELVAGDLDERALELAGLGELLVGPGELGVGRLELGDQPLPLGEQLVLLGRLADDPLELGGVPGLEDVAEDVPFVDGVDDGLDVGVAGEEHPDRVGLEPAGPG